MLLVLYTVIITLSNFNFNLKSNSVCYAQYTDNQGKSYMNSMIHRIKDSLSNFQTYVGRRAKTSTPGEPTQDITAKIEDAIQEVNTLKTEGHKNYEQQIAKSGLPIRVKKVKPSIRNNLNTDQLIRSHGYVAQTHKIHTFDGYVLNVHRIVTTNKKSTNEIVILHHGLFCSSEDWLLLDTHLCLPCLLSDQGYDVWLLNARGSKYSKTHESLDWKAYEFWNFSWHEMGVYDLPAALTYIGDYASMDKVETNLHYIGHSVGATALLVLLSSIDEYNDKIKTAILLGPITFMKHCKGPIKRLHKSMISPQISEPLEFIADEHYLRRLLKKYCPKNTVCKNPLILLADGGNDKHPSNFSENIIEYVPSGGSTKTIVHYMQLIKTNNFQLYNRGLLMNLKTYQLKYPPSYKLSKIRVPIILFTSIADYLATKSDIRTLLGHLPSVQNHYIVKEKNFHHYDYVWSTDAAHMIYYPLINDLETITATRSINTFVTSMI